jgi:hypothetical protein
VERCFSTLIVAGFAADKGDADQELIERRMVRRSIKNCAAQIIAACATL